MAVNSLIIASVAFALYVTCPRMTAMIATQTKISGLNPYLMISLGCIIGIPLFFVLFYVLRHYGVGITVFLAAVLDLGAILLLGNLDIKVGIELGIITGFVYTGIRVAPIVAEYLTSNLG